MLKKLFLVSLFVLLLCSDVFGVSYSGNNNSGFMTEYVGIVTIDGIRKDNADSVITRNKYATKDFVMVDPFYGSRPFITVDSHANIFTGTENIFTVRNSNPNNLSCSPASICYRSPDPTIFEIIRAAFSLPDTAVWSFVGKTYINHWAVQSAHNGLGSGDKPLGTSTPPVGFYAPKRKTVTSTYYGTSNFEGPDTAIYHVVIDTLTRYHPKLFFVNLSEEDAFTHGQTVNYPFGSGSTGADTLKYHARNDTICYTAFAIVDSIWDFIQNDATYQNKTTLFITTDHGRHLNSSSSGNDADGDPVGIINHTHWDLDSSPVDTLFSTADNGCKNIFLQIRTPDRAYRYQGGYGHTNIAPTICKMLGVPSAIEFTTGAGVDFYYWEATMDSWMSRVFADPQWSRWKLNAANARELHYLRDALTDSLDRRYFQADVDSIFEISTTQQVTANNIYNITLTPVANLKSKAYTLYGLQITSLGKDNAGADTITVQDSLIIYFGRSTDSLKTDPYDFSYGPIALASGSAGVPLTTSLSLTQSTALTNLSLYRQHVNNLSWTSDLWNSAAAGDPIFKIIKFNPPFTYFTADSSMHLHIQALLNEPSSKVLKQNMTFRIIASKGATHPLRNNNWTVWRTTINPNNQWFDIQAIPRGQ